MEDIHVQAFALAAPLVAMLLVSWGSTDGPVAATAVGAVLVAAGLVSLTALRFVDLEDGS